MAEVMARVEGDLGDHVDGQRLVGDLDAAHHAQHGAEHVIVDDEALERHAQEARVHARGFVNHGGPGETGEGGRITLLEPRLGVGHLRIGHARRDANRQSVEIGHLGARRHEERLLTAAAAHRAGAQVGDERPGTEQDRVTR